MDTDFEAGSTAGGGVDSAFAAMAKVVDSTPEPDRKVGVALLPKFKYYIVTPASGKGQFTKGGLASAHFGFTVKVGPEGTIGKTIYDDLPLEASLEVDEKDPETGEFTKRPRTEAELASARQTVANSVARLSGRAGFSQHFPSNRTQEDLDLFASQIMQAPELVMEVRVQGGGDKYEPKNRINWLSLARTDDPVKRNGKVVEGKSALDQALEEIEKYNKNQAAKAGTSGAGAVGANLSPSDIV